MKKTNILAIVLAFCMASATMLSSCGKTGITSESTSASESGSVSESASASESNSASESASASESNSASETTSNSTSESSSEGDSGNSTIYTDAKVDAYGTISFTAAYDYSDKYGDKWEAGDAITINQLVALEYLNFLINKGTSYVDAVDRAPVYEEALNILALLNIEIPTYQRKDWTLYNHNVIDDASVTWSQTAYYGLLSEIWNLKYASGAAPDNLVIQQSNYSEVFNPFFCSSAYDQNVVSMANIGLLASNEFGVPVAGTQYPSLAKSYSVSYDKDSDTSTYEFVLKNGVKFSDGTAVTMDDVLFNLYTYLDPAYDGSSVLYSLDIKGLDQYRSQVADYDTYAPIAEAIRAAGPNYTVKEGDSFTQAQYNIFWNMVYDYGTTFSQNIIDYCVGNYGDDDSVKAYFSSDFTSTDVKKDANHENAFGLIMWGFGSLDENNHVIGVSGKDYGAFGGDFTFTLNDYWSEVKAKYTKDGVVNYEELYSVEGASDADCAYLDTCITKTVHDLGATAEGVKSVSGITTTKKTIDGVSYDVLDIKLNGQSAKAIYQFSFTIAEKSYYTSGFSYTEGAIVNGGVQLGLLSDGSTSTAFMDQLKTKNNKPVGAGAYYFDKYENNVVYLKVNPYFYTVSGVYTSNAEAVNAYTTAMASAATPAEKAAVKGIHNAYIPNVSMPVIVSGQELPSLENVNVHIATVSATKEDVNAVQTDPKYAFLTSIFTDYLGYGYICINANNFNNLYERVAVKSVFDTASAVADYYGELAEPIYRSISLTSWAAPEYTRDSTSDFYPYDVTCASAKAYLARAGYTLNNEGKMVDSEGNQFSITFNLPMAADEHPAGKIFTNAKTLLESIGCKVELVIDTNLISNITTGTTDCYALAWQATVDPDMFQVYSVDSTASSPVSSGIIGLYSKLVAASTRKTVA